MLVAIDPGDKYCGVAFFERDKESKYGWTCVHAQEYDPDQFCFDLAETIIDGDIEYIVYERFRLYADKAMLQTGSEFKTAQVIGVIKWLVAAQNKHADQHEHVEAAGGMLSCEVTGGPCSTPREVPRVHLVGQMADIKKPTRAILRAKKIKSVARKIAREEYGGREHIIDAELHGWKYILDPKGHANA